MPGISICLPTLNARRFLEPRMESIFVQTLLDWELIVCDSYSDDGTWEYLQQFRDDPRVRLYQVPREGLYAGWNECLKRCRGEYVYIATADDTMRADCLEKMVGALGKVESRKSKVEIDKGGILTTEDTEGTERETLDVKRETINVPHSKTLQSDLCCVQSDPTGLPSSVFGLQSDRPRPIDICVCGFDVIDEEGVVVADHPAARWPKKFYGDWMDVPHIRDGRTEFLLHASLGSIWWTMTAVLFRRSLLTRVGLFRTDRGSGADEEWQMRAALVSDVLFIPERLATWRVHASQASAAQRRQARGALGMIESVLDDDNSGIPEAWRENPRWREKILCVQRAEWLDSLQLYANVLKSAPCSFLRGFWIGLLYEKRFLLNQILRGFLWNPDCSRDPIVHARGLIDTFYTGWPPTPLPWCAGDLLSKQYICRSGC